VLILHTFRGCSGLDVFDIGVVGVGVEDSAGDGDDGVNEACGVCGVTGGCGSTGFAVLELRFDALLPIPPRPFKGRAQGHTK